MLQNYKTASLSKIKSEFKGMQEINETRTNKGCGIKVNPVEAETTGLNESDSFLPVVSEADLSTGPP